MELCQAKKPPVQQRKITAVVKRQHAEWEKIFSKPISDKGLIYKTDEESNQWKSIGYRPEQMRFSKEDVQVVNSCMKEKFLPSLSIREMQAKTSVKYIIAC